MDDLHTRLDTLEQQTAALAHHTRQVTRQLRWWRGLACSLLALALLTWMLPVTTAQEDSYSGWRGLPERVAALENLLEHFSREGNEVFITGANLHIANGLGRSHCEEEPGKPVPNCPNGLGNLIVGYNELRSGEPSVRSGSHYIIVGSSHNYSHYVGFVLGDRNEIAAPFSSILAGSNHIASGWHSSVSGGEGNKALGQSSSVTGGAGNTASGPYATVCGGDLNTASGNAAVVSGGALNIASGDDSSVSGGNENEASGLFSSVSGGLNRTAKGESDWAAGGLFQDE